MIYRSQPLPPRRASLPLVEQDQIDLELLRSSDSHRDALNKLTGRQIHAASSEASLLHALLEAGLAATKEQAEREGYAQLAAERSAESSQRQAIARRRTPAWANEE